MSDSLNFRGYYRNLPVAFWKICLTALLIAVFFILQEYINHLVKGHPFAFSWFDVSVKTIATFLLWALLAPLVWAFAKRVSFKDFRSSFKTVLLSLLLSFLQQTMAASLIALGYLINVGAWIQIFSPDRMTSNLLGLFSSLVQLVFYVAMFLFFDYYQRYLEKQKELNNAQLYALKMKLHPHFLFNTLHAISSMIDYNSEGAQKMLTRLGSLFRTILENEDQQTVSLEEELKYIQDYLDIEQVRFEEQLEVSFDVSDDTLDARVPSLILQPLVENCIKHGISSMSDKGCIQIMTERVKGLNGAERVALMVRDNGKGFGKSRQTSFGIGIKNVNDRLSRLYQEDFYFDIRAGESSGAVAKIEIPYLQKI
ncbi:MAG: histidine kinase [Roseivirga sp.]|nr:histidine kinase [Roseivirga sp.]